MEKDLLKNLTEEQIAKIRKCKSQDELLELAKNEGVELSDEQLEAVAGGFCDSSDFRWQCPKCGSSDTEVRERYEKGTPNEYVLVHCNKCGANFIKS